MTRTWVVTERKVSSSKIMAIWGDRFEDGVLARENDYYGDAYAEPGGKVYDWCVKDWWGRYLIYVRQSFYDALGQDERDWLIGKGVKVVSADWYPGFVCKEGEKRNPTTCWDDSVIHTEVCRDNAWVLTGETCPTKPECTAGDKKAGYICEGGKWVAYTPPVVPPVEPVEPVEPPVVQPVAPPKYLTPEQADERIRAGLPCYIKCTLPILGMLPGIPYTPGMWVLPFFAITAEP